MNFLAHFHLAWPESGLVAGALEGDYHKGPLRGTLSPDIEDGVRLHRAIDAFTDGHRAVCEARRRFPPGLRRYAGILIDLSFDHFLTRDWSRHSELPLAAFNASVYATLRERESELGEGARRMLDRLLQQDILNQYHRWETVSGSAERIGTRLRRGNALRDVAQPLAALEGDLEQAFRDFYPDLQSFSDDYRRRLN